MYAVYEYEKHDDPWNPTQVSRITNHETIADVAEALDWDEVCLIPMRDQRDVFVAVTLDDLFAQFSGSGAPLRFWLITPEDWDVPIDWQFDAIVHNQLGDLQG